MFWDNVAHYFELFRLKVRRKFELRLFAKLFAVTDVRIVKNRDLASRIKSVPGVASLFEASLWWRWLI